MLVGVISLAEGLLSCHIILACEDTLRSWSSVVKLAVVIVEHGTAIIKSLLLFLGAFFEKDLAKNILFLLV
jgi:hypothetical protein